VASAPCRREIALRSPASLPNSHIFRSQERHKAWPPSPVVVLNGLRPCRELGPSRPLRPYQRPATKRTSIMTSPGKLMLHLSRSRIGTGRNLVQEVVLVPYQFAFSPKSLVRNTFFQCPSRLMIKSTLAFKSQTSRIENCNFSA